MGVRHVSLSLRRAWIEMSRPHRRIPSLSSLSLRRAWIEISTQALVKAKSRSLSLRRAWIEIRRISRPLPWIPRRSPYGERGLKYVDDRLSAPRRLSLSLRRAWIEIRFQPRVERDNIGRSPYGERGLKSDCLQLFVLRKRRSPYGERGLKSRLPPVWRRPLRSLSLRRAWIEISMVVACRLNSRRSLSLRRAWIEMLRR